jgi:hypothetical protein
MLLGTIMTRLQDEGVAAATLMSLGDIVLVAEVEAARLPHAESLGEYVSGAAQRFAGLASDEDWLALMTALEGSDNPAAACLATMLRWSIARDAEAAAAETGGASPGGCCCAGGKGKCQ